MGFKDAGKPHYLGHRERLRRRFRDAGADALPDYELLELILFRAAPRRDTKPLAKALLARFGTFAEAVNAPEELLREVPGIGEAAVTKLKLVRAAALRLMRGEVLGAPGAVVLGAGARLLPRVHGLRVQGAIPHAVVHGSFLLSVQSHTLYVPHASPMRPLRLVL
jgi:uncharacterized protein UPF0758